MVIATLSLLDICDVWPMGCIMRVPTPPSRWSSSPSSYTLVSYIDTRKDTEGGCVEPKGMKLASYQTLACPALQKPSESAPLGSFDTGVMDYAVGHRLLVSLSTFVIMLRPCGWKMRSKVSSVELCFALSSDQIPSCWICHSPTSR